MVDKNGPDLSGATPTKGKKILNNIVGFFENHDHPIMAGLTAAVIDKFMGDGYLGSAEGALMTDRLEKAGLPGWAAILGGMWEGRIGTDSPIKGALLAMFAPVIVGIVTKLADKFQIGQKLENLTGLSLKDLTPPPLSA